MGSLIISRALLIALACGHITALTSLSAAGDDNDCALYLSGPGRTSAYDYSLNLLKGNFAYEGQHTCITYDAVNQAYLEARNRIVVSQPKGDWKAEDFASAGELILDISINLARRYGLTYEEIEKGLPLIDTSRTLIRDICPPVFSHVECRAGKYRRLDGLCNNLQHPTWGSTMSPFQRLLGPLFADGINAPRIAHTGRDLPLSRVVSRTMHPDDGYHDHAGTVMVIAWGQFMDHDYTLTGTPLDPINRNDPEECCKRPPHLKHPYCNEIRIPEDDRFYGLWNVKCIDFVRAFPSPRPGCRLGSRVPFNTLTGVIDGNTVYGVTDKFARKLRTGFGGLLRMNPVFEEYGLKDLLPLKLDIPDEGCTRPNKQMYCFEGGEIRVNEQLILTVMHTLMAREHNRIAKALTHVNPHWDDETLYQETRRINIAEIQHITYNEFLPILLGKDVMEKFGLVLEKEGYWEGYDESVNPDVIDAFASAAFRFGHSLLPTAVERWSKAHKFIASKRLSDLIRRPFDLYRAGVLDEYVMGLMNQVAQAMDDSITQEVTNHLFKKVGARFGMDLVSFNMQRGREFGIPGYMEFRKFCGLNGADSFQDLFGSMPNETVRKYESIFEHPIDVDLWSGGVSERPLPGSMLGPTFACVIATQFSYSRRGDRFWFELPNQPSSFTPEQLKEIRKARLARIICDNTDIIDTVQLYPMVLPDHELNPRVPCRSGIIPSMDFSKWAEPAPFHGAKPFVTEAFVPVRNETKTEDQLDETKVNKIELNGTRNDVKTYENSTESSIQITPCDDKNCTQNVNCTECHNKLKESYGTDTVLKYVYKKDDKLNISPKPSGHLKNSVKRKRRSTEEKLQYAESAPVIVNYETSHGTAISPPFERQTNGIIKSADLADFNIETLHDIEHDKNEEINDRKNYEDSNKQSQPQEGKQGNDNIQREKEDSDENKENADRERNYSSEVEDSAENHNENNDRYRKENTSEERSEEKSHNENNDRYRKENTSEERSEEKDRYNSRDEDRNSELNKEDDNSSEREDYRNKDSTFDSNEENHSDERNRNKSESSEEKNEYRQEQPHDSRESKEHNEYRNENKGYIPYRDHEQSDERSNFREDKANSSKRRTNGFYPESDERNENSGTKENDDSHGETYNRGKSTNSNTSEDSNEGIERSDESSKLRQDNRNNFNYKDNHEIDGNLNSKERLLQQKRHPPKYSVNNEFYKNDRVGTVESSSPESREDETIIAVINKKNKNPLHDYSLNDKEELNSPNKIKDIDLDDFNHYERIHLNDKGKVEPLPDTHDNYDTLSSPIINPITTSEPYRVPENDKQLARSTESAEIPSSRENNEENEQLIHIDNEEVKPVVEINVDKEESSEENSKEALRANSNEDTSLETLLGVNLNSDEKSDKIVSQPEEQDRGDVKQQFERIPLNYNHAKKKEENGEQPGKKSNKQYSETQKSDPKPVQDTVDVFTPNKPVQYDDNLNIKFDDVSIKLPDIKLPEDILAFPHEEPFYVKKGKKKTEEPSKNKFFQYDEHEFHESPHSPNHKNEEHDNDDNTPKYYTSNYGESDTKQDYRKKDKKHEKNDEEEEEEDLYEKFVRERFGKRNTFAKRSERLTAPTQPAEENQKLFQSLNQVLKRAANIEKEAQQSGDPNAGYMWTVEYGKPL